MTAVPQPTPVGVPAARRGLRALLAANGVSALGDGAFLSAAAEAVIADLTGRDEQELHKVNGRLQAATTAGRQLLGPPGGSWSFAVAGWLPFAADAVSFLGSAALLTAIPPHPAAASRPRQRMWPAVREGGAYLVGHRELRTLALLTAAGNASVMTREFPGVQFERFADDVVVHCVTERQARTVREAIGRRLVDVGLLLHPDKTRIVYCKDYK